VVESNNQSQSQRDYLPLLDISTNEAKQQSNTLHIGTHILSENNKDNTQSSNQTHYQLTMLFHGSLQPKDSIYSHVFGAYSYV
jgi:hypothetical protein